MFLFEFIYSIGTQGYFLAIRLAAFFNSKAKQWVSGREDLFIELESAFAKKEDSIIWVHCASLGEFEQGRPVIETIKEKHPTYKILLTFFSPSGYEIRKNYQLADFVFYLPSDSNKNAFRFLEIVNPKLTIFVKYEFWYFYLKALNKKKIPTFLISASFRSDQLFFKKSINRIHLKMLQSFEHFFVQNLKSKQLLETIGFSNITVAGDTRVDRVCSISANVKSIPEFVTFCGNNKILVCGSTWPKDESILFNFINQKNGSWKIIMAPHDISEIHIRQICKNLEVDFVNYSNLNNLDNKTLEDARVFIIDNIGLLSSLYQFGELAYIGGGFGAGIHNILEPAAFKLPVIFGPKHHKFQEATDLIGRNGAFGIKDEHDFWEVLEFLEIESNLKSTKLAVTKYIQENRGATMKIMNYLSKYFSKD